MNVQGLVSGGIGAVNPNVPVAYQVYMGEIAQANGKQLPVYANPVTATMQVQELSSNELQLLHNLNITGIIRKVYLNGQLNALMRAAQTGGDKLVFNGFTWLVAHVLESFPDWSCVVVKQQVQP